MGLMDTGIDLAMMVLALAMDLCPIGGNDCRLRHGCAFEQDDQRDPKASLTCRRYADKSTPCWRAIQASCSMAEWAAGKPAWQPVSPAYFSALKKSKQNPFGTKWWVKC